MNLLSSSASIHNWILFFLANNPSSINLGINSVFRSSYLCLSYLEFNAESFIETPFEYLTSSLLDKLLPVNSILFLYSRKYFSASSSVLAPSPSISKEKIFCLYFSDFVNWTASSILALNTNCFAKTITAFLIIPLKTGSELFFMRLL